MSIEAPAVVLDIILPRWRAEMLSTHSAEYVCRSRRPCARVFIPRRSQTSGAAPNFWWIHRRHRSTPPPRIHSPPRIHRRRGSTRRRVVVDPAWSRSAHSDHIAEVDPVTATKWIRS
jgi:hypothetical protein